MDAADQILSAEASLALGDSYLIDENFESAIDAYAIAISTCYDDERGKVTRFRALSHKVAALSGLERYNEAVDDGQLALAAIVPGLREGETEACYFRLGVALYQLKRYGEAQAMFQQALQLASLNKTQLKRARCYVDYIQRCTMTIAINDQDLETVVLEEIQQKSPAQAASTSSKVISASASTTTAKIHKPTMPKYQYYQTDKVMTIAILEPNMRNEDLRISFGRKRLTAIVKKQGVEFTVICGKLYDKVNTERCKVVIKSEKVLIKLYKVDPHDWHELFSKQLNDDDDDEDDITIKKSASASAPDENPTIHSGETTAAKTAVPKPYASHRDWNAIERDLKQLEKQEKPQGEEAMNALFQKIYEKSDPDTRRAMIKSFQTSGGTVLSTNWNEVKEKDYEKEREAPKGMEWKTWEGEKLENPDP